MSDYNCYIIDSELAATPENYESKGRLEVFMTTSEKSKDLETVLQVQAVSCLVSVSNRIKKLILTNDVLTRTDVEIHGDLELVMRKTGNLHVASYGNAASVHIRSHLSDDNNKTIVLDGYFKEVLIETHGNVKLFVSGKITKLFLASFHAQPARYIVDSFSDKKCDKVDHIAYIGDITGNCVVTENIRTVCKN